MLGVYLKLCEPVFETQGFHEKTELGHKCFMGFMKERKQFSQLLDSAA